ncbi:MAG: hypothetical protein HY976_04205 [Candidatus Kerfeldbacteria bacterium]|nr:hypothetical protein [Candidatus Kerfeldbacteria bacterium]
MPTLTDRKRTILTDIIRTYVAAAHPVGSSAIVDSSKLDVSPATVRNEMLELEDEGFLFQPHTSAGRIPTEKAWRFYLDQVMEERPVGKNRQEELAKIAAAHQQSRHERLKHLAQQLTEYTHQAAVVAFSPTETYYTGFSKLFGQPEFEEVDLIRSLTVVVDHLDEKMPEFFRKLSGDVTVLIGSDNPFSRDCGFVMTGMPGQRGLFGLLGPIRQDYGQTVPLVRFTRQLLS